MNIILFEYINFMNLQNESQCLVIGVTWWLNSCQTSVIQKHRHQLDTIVSKIKWIFNSVQNFQFSSSKIFFSSKGPKVYFSNWPSKVTHLGLTKRKFLDHLKTLSKWIDIRHITPQIDTAEAQNVWSRKKSKSTTPPIHNCI